HRPILLLHDRVPPRERGRRGQGVQSSTSVFQPVTRPVQRRRQAAAGTVTQLHDLLGEPIQLTYWIGQRRTRTDALQPGELTFQCAPQHATAPITQLTDQLQLLPDVGDHPLGGVGGGGGPHVGDVVEQRRVLFVADRTHHRGGGRRDRAHQRLVGERQQVLQGTAPTGDDDHV